jgi:hypothetical protein
MIKNRIRHLEEMHAILDKQIDGLESTGAFHDENLSAMKKRRLQIRDQIERLRKQQDHESVGTDDE